MPPKNKSKAKEKAEEKAKAKEKTRPLVIAAPKPTQIHWEEIKGLDYELIGEGTFADVYRFVMDNKTLAIKQYKRYNDHKAQWEREIEILTDFLEHENFIHLVSYGADFDAEKLFLIMEYVPMTMTLDKKLKDESWGEVPWQPVLKILQGIASALVSLHSHGWVYSDLKPDNIVISEDFRAIMIDFGGLVREDRLIICDNDYYDPHPPKAKVGRAGRVGRAESSSGKRSLELKAKKPLDVYSFGVLMLQLVMKWATTRKGKEYIVDRLDKPPEKIVHDSLSNTGCDVVKVVELVRRCICKEENRATMDEVVQDLELLKKKKK